MAAGEQFVEVQSYEVLKAIRLFAKQTGIELKDVYVDQMRLMNNHLIRLYPPKTYAQGRRAIKTDLENLFIRPDDFGVVSQWAGIGEGAPPVVFRTSKGAILGVEQRNINLSGDPAKLRAHHQKHRMKNGRVTKAGAFTRNIGRWKYIDRMVVADYAYQRYLKTVQKKVGMLKKGWIPKKGTVRYPVKAANYIRNSSGGEQAEMLDRMNPNASGYLKLENNIDYAYKHPGLVKIALGFRSRDLKKWAKLRVDEMTKRFNSGTLVGTV